MATAVARWLARMSASRFESSFLCSMATRNSNPGKFADFLNLLILRGFRRTEHHLAGHGNRA